MTTDETEHRQGGYDFRRDLFFDRIGAVGFGYGRIGVTPATDGEGAVLRAGWRR